MRISLPGVDGYLSDPGVDESEQYTTGDGYSKPYHFIPSAKSVSFTFLPLPSPMLFINTRLIGQSPVIQGLKKLMDYITLSD